MKDVKLRIALLIAIDVLYYLIVITIIGLIIETTNRTFTWKNIITVFMMCLFFVHFKCKLQKEIQ